MNFGLRHWTTSTILIACLLGSAAFSTTAQQPAASTEEPDASQQKIVEPAEAIEFVTMAQAFASGVANERVTTLVFSAEWCGACQKLDRAVFADEKVRRAATQMSWAKIDLEKDPLIAAMFGVRAVPTVIFLNTKGEPLHQHSGLLSADQMTALIEQYASDAAAPGTAQGKQDQLAELLAQAEAVESASDIPVETIEAILGHIASPDPIGGEEMRHRILTLGPSAWHALADCLDHRELAVRAAAYDLLKRSTGHALPYDPFLAVDERDAQRAAWQAWVQTQRPRSQSSPAESDSGTSSVDDELIKKSPPPAPR
jgi:thioredoxin-like negative regulator of GroEL